VAGLGVVLVLLISYVKFDWCVAIYLRLIRKECRFTISAMR